MKKLFLVFVTIVCCYNLFGQVAAPSPYAFMGDNTPTLDLEHQGNDKSLTFFICMADSTLGKVEVINNRLVVTSANGEIINSQPVKPIYRAMFLSLDSKSEEMTWMSPYAFCFGNPINFIDVNGCNPIYSIEGNFLGTDDLGLQGEYYIINANDFVQSMSHWEAGMLSVLAKDNISSKVINTIESHFSNLPTRPDYDGFVTISEGVAWAKMHPRALANPTPDNTLYIDASKLDFGDLSVSDFKNVGTSEPQELFSWPNTFSSLTNSTLRGTVYALGKVDMKLLDLEAKTVKIMDTGRTDYDWNYGGSLKRNAALFINNVCFGINNNIHGFKTYYYGIGRLNQ